MKVPKIPNLHHSQSILPTMHQMQWNWRFAGVMCIQFELWMLKVTVRTLGSTYNVQNRWWQYVYTQWRIWWIVVERHEKGSGANICVSSVEYRFTSTVIFSSSSLLVCSSFFWCVWDTLNFQKRWQQESLKSRNCYNIEIFFRGRLLTARFELQYYAWFFVDWPGVNKVKIWPIHTVLWYREDCMTTVTATIPLWNFVGESWYCNSPLILSSDTRLGFDFDFWHTIHSLVCISS